MSLIQKSHARSRRRRRADRQRVLCMHRRSASLVLHGRLAKAATKLGISYATNLQAGIDALPMLITNNRDGKVEFSPGCFNNSKSKS